MAKKFQFRLQPVLKYRHWIEGETRQRFLHIQGVRDEKQHNLEDLRLHTTKALEAMTEAKNGAINIQRVRLLNRYLTGLNISTTQCQGELKVIDQEVDKRREELVSARRDVKSMERLKGRRKRQYEYEEQREQTGLLDEIGGSAHRRRQVEEERS